MRNVNLFYADFGLESFQDFLITLDMKQHMHLVEISIFSINNVTIRSIKTKIFITIFVKRWSASPIFYNEKNWKSTGKSLSEALLFAEHGENMWCTKIVLNLRNNFCTQHVLPRFELGIFMY